MIYYGMTPDPALSAKMVMTELELKRIKHSKLRPQCYENGGKYYCFHGAGKNQKGLGTFDTIYDCNEAWDKYDKNPKEVKKKGRQPNGKGYTQITYSNKANKYRPQIHYKNKMYTMGAVDTKEEAHNLYLEGINQINSGTFEEWHASMGYAECQK